jgi:Amt family ammonium transporter
MGNINTGDTAFVLISGALVALMTPGLAFFYGGLVRRKNVLAIMMQSFIAMGIVTLIWVLGGYSLAFGPDVGGGIIGNLQYFALNGVTGQVPAAVASVTENGHSVAAHIPFLAHFGYQEMFAIITPALITGAFADRVTFKAFLAFLVGWSVLVYLPFCHWVWGGGFLAKWGLVDFAGGIVVHLSAGVAALASVIFVGRRKLSPGEVVAPHNIAFVALGTGLLWFGWFGFNGGSALGANALAATAFVNTDIAGSVAMIAWLAVAWWKEGKPSMTGALTGAVAGLATVTPCAGFVQPWGAAIIGLLAGLICYGAVLLRAKRGIDDALDVFACHGVGGILGTICVGIFAAKSVNGISGLIEGDVRQFGVQCAGVAICAVYSFIVTLGMLKIINVFTPVRVPDAVETKGLDKELHGETAYDLGGGAA